jgi:DNA polymerase-1
MLKNYYHLYPEVENYQAATAAHARRYGFVRDLFGRIRYIPEVVCPVNRVNSEGERMASNMPIQAGAQGIIKLAMAQLWRETPSQGHPGSRDYKFLMQIHDELMLEVKEEAVQPVARWIKNVMEGVTALSVPVIATVKVGHRWGELKEMEL